MRWHSLPARRRASSPASPGARRQPISLVAPECLPGAATGTGPLTRSASPAPTAIARALVANPQLQIAGAQAHQARARKVQGVALPDPTFGAELDNSKAPFGIGGDTGRILGASITVPFFDKFRLNGRIGSAGIQQSQFDSVAVRQSIASQTLADLRLAARGAAPSGQPRQADSLARDFATKTRARFDAGTVARLDVINADVAVGQVGNELIANERDIANARSSLESPARAAPLGAPIATADSLDVPPPLPELAVLEAAALRSRPELASLQSQRTGARATTQLAREFWLPDLTIGVSTGLPGRSDARVPDHHDLVSYSAALLESQQGRDRPGQVPRG